MVKAKGVPHEDRPKAIKKALDRCSLEVVADRLIGNISRGYRQRVGLAQAIVNDPPVLILDEPSVGLDPEQIKNFRDLILSFVGSSTVLLSTHILSEVSKTCQRVCIIDHGKILAVDTPDNLENRTRNGIRLRMQILAPRADEVFESLKSIKGFSGLRNTSFAKLEGSDWPLLTFEANVGFQDNLAARRDLCDMLAQKHWNLYGLADEHTSLEDAFITLVRDHEAELADEADASQEASAESRAVDEQTNKKTDADGDSSKGQIEQGNLTDPPVSDPQAATKSAGESQKGGATGSLEDLRGKTQDTADEEEQKTQMEWSEDRKQPSVVLLILPQEDEQALNELLYEVALFNFSQFLIRDFDLQKMPVYKTTCALRVSGFADLDEAEWWIDLMQKNAEMQTRLEQIQIKAVTEVNLPLL